MTQGCGGAWKAQEEGPICIHITDAHWSTEETNTTLHTNCTQIIFKNEQTSGVGVGGQEMGLLLFREEALQSAQHLCIRLVICGPDNKCGRNWEALKGH